MVRSGRITGRLVAAARALTGVSEAVLATDARIPLERLRVVKSRGSSWLSDEDSEILRRALEAFGAVFIPEGDGMGAGVRLKFNRNDVGSWAVGKAKEASLGRTTSRDPYQRSSTLEVCGAALREQPRRRFAMSKSAFEEGFPRRLWRKIWSGRRTNNSSRCPRYSEEQAACGGAAIRSDQRGGS